MLAQGRDLRVGVGSTGQAETHLLHQHVSRRGQQHAKGVRQKVRATDTADLHAVVQFFYPVLDVTTLTVNLLVNPDRKSTRLNSSHVEISYAVFCLKKKKK